MREILFRGRTKAGEWIEGFYGVKGEEEYEKHFIMQNTFDANMSSYPFYFTDYEVDPETAGQYIGLKDKSGTKVFEGDIIELFSDTFYVGFKDGEYILKSPESGESLSILLLQTEKFHVEGNIYDNPELLEVHHE